MTALPAITGPSPPARSRPSTFGAVADGVFLGLAILAYVAEFGRLTWSQQSNFGTMDYDLGIFDQEVWLSAHHLNPFLSG